MGRPRRRAPNRADPPVLTVYRRARASLRGVIPEIDIWGVANLMLKRYGNRARQESARHADELWAAGDATGEVIWLRVGDVIGQLANTTPPGPKHRLRRSTGSFRCSRDPRCSTRVQTKRSRPTLGTRFYRPPRYPYLKPARCEDENNVPRMAQPVADELAPRTWATTHRTPQQERGLVSICSCALSATVIVPTPW